MDLPRGPLTELSPLAPPPVAHFQENDVQVVENIYSAPAAIATGNHVATPGPVTATAGQKRSAIEATNGGGKDDDGIEYDENDDTRELTDQQRLERRERNREHAKRSRLRKKFLLESLQEQIHGLEEQIDSLKSAVRSEVAAPKAEEIIRKICGDKEKYTPLPMPSGFGPVKTLMEPDFRLSKLICALLCQCNLIHFCRNLF
jgi:Basic region leucine zipper